VVVVEVVVDTHVLECRVVVDTHVPMVVVDTHVPPIDGRLLAGGTWLSRNQK
jgi:hypothetical protein